jgi:predicted CopG family antitoxin
MGLRVGGGQSGGEITNPIEYIVFDMSSSIRISDETKAKLEAVKREDETFDELLDRLAITRTEKDVREMAGFAEEGVEEHMKQKREDLNDSFEARTTGAE